MRFYWLRHTGRDIMRLLAPLDLIDEESKYFTEYTQHSHMQNWEFPHAGKCSFVLTSTSKDVHKQLQTFLNWHAWTCHIYAEALHKQ